MVLTPCTRSIAFGDLLACSLWLKFETRQRTGSFKDRVMPASCRGSTGALHGPLGCPRGVRTPSASLLYSFLSRLIVTPKNWNQNCVPAHARYVLVSVC